MFHESDRAGSGGPRSARRRRRSARRIDPLARDRQARRAARAVPGELQERAVLRAATSSGCCRALQGVSRSPSSSATAASARIRRGDAAARASTARRWSRSTSPSSSDSIRQNRRPNVKTIYYMRLHGRNAAQWWSHEKSEDRYNYLYSADRAGSDRRRRGRGVARREEDATVRQQSLLGEVGRERARRSRTSSGSRCRANTPGRSPSAILDLKGLVKILPTRPSHTLV